MRYLLLILMLYIPTVYAGTGIELHAASKHKNSTYVDDAGVKHKYNEINTGLGVVKDITNNVSLTAGGYKNSFSHTSYYAGGDIHTNSNEPISVGMTMGVITGYDYSDIFVLPNVIISNKYTYLKVGYLPYIDKGKPALFTLSIGILL